MRERLLDKEVAAAPGGLERQGHVQVCGSGNERDVWRSPPDRLDLGDHVDPRLFRESLARGRIRIVRHDVGAPERNEIRSMASADRSAAENGNGHRYKTGSE